MRSQQLKRRPLPPVLLPRFDVPHEPLSSGEPDRLVGAPLSTSMSTSRSNSQKFLLIEIRNSATRSTPLCARGLTEPSSTPTPGVSEATCDTGAGRYAILGWGARNVAAIANPAHARRRAGDEVEPELAGDAWCYVGVSQGAIDDGV